MNSSSTQPREDLSTRLPEDWRSFNREFVPVIMGASPGKTRIGAGLNAGALWSVAKGILIGDVVLCPDASGRFHVAEVTGDYTYGEGGVLPHRRPVTWLPTVIDRADISESLWRSIRPPGTAVNITPHAEEVEALIGGSSPVVLIATDESVEDPVAFAMERHLEDFLVGNWRQTVLGADYDIFEEDGEPVGQQYQTDTGPIDILAISRDRTKLLVVELKRGRASDVVVGQILRYIGFVQSELAEPDQTVSGAIIALDEDSRLRWALSAVPNVAFYRYEVDFRLIPSASS